MIDKNASRNCLEGCLSHNAEGTAQPDSLDPEILSYFLVRRNFNAQSNETASISHRNSNTQNHEAPSTSHRKRHIRHRSSERSPRSPNSAKSGDSRGSKRRNGNSIGSSHSASSRYPNITDWSAGIKTTSSSSFGPPQRNPIDPPRPPKSGHEWVWFPEGYWAEREIRGFMPPSHDLKQKWWSRSPAQKSQKSLASQKSHSPTKTANEEKNANDNKNPLSFIPQIKIGSVSLKSTTKTSRQTSRQTSQHTSNASRKSSSLWRFNFTKPLKEASQPFPEREGLYCRTKRTIETRLRKRSADKLSVRSLEGPGSLASRTTMLLQGASTYFDRTQRRSNRLVEISPSPSSLDGKRRPKLGVAPWHRRRSHDSILSVTSSVRNLLMGKTPIATPIPEKHYVGPDGKTYPAVKLASDDPHAPTFLPSEARRINTPPLYPGSPDSQPLGRLFDVSATGEGESSVHSEHTPPEPGGTSKASPPLSRGLWEADIKNANTGNKSIHPPGRAPPANLMSPTLFEFNLPEHLPSSPLCPKNPKHRSGRTGTCVYHGRRKSVGLKHQKRASTATEESFGNMKKL